MINIKDMNLLYVYTDTRSHQKNTPLLLNSGLNILNAESSAVACDLIQTKKVDIALIDHHVLDKSGLEPIRCLRQKELMTPIIMITALADPAILLHAINLGITRCLIKPFKKSELLHAVQIAKKRVLYHQPISSISLHERFMYDPINKMVNSPDNRSIQLSKKEYLFLELFLKNKQKIVPYSTIETFVWQETGMSMDALRTLVRSIRIKTYPHLLTNVSGVGYIMDLS
ncbi:response regulator transcription factor [Sulfuricurvum sp.]|uniref:response regulator transcription factor n=1 Tax=Sulfuricurvum sp. TaxID=2025608 RepID=UPI0035675389